MSRQKIRLSHNVIFESLRDVLLSEIRGYNGSGHNGRGKYGFIAKVNQEDTLYLVRKTKPREINFFASVQIRSRGVYLQLNNLNTPLLASMFFLSQCTSVKIESATGSLIFTSPIRACEAILRELIRKAFDDKS